MVAIQVTETFEVARVEVGDDYRVHLWQAYKASSYTPTQALQLSQELAQAALEARKALSEHLGRLVDSVPPEGQEGPL